MSTLSTDRQRPSGTLAPLPCKLTDQRSRVEALTNVLQASAAPQGHWPACQGQSPPTSPAPCSLRSSAAFFPAVGSPAASGSSSPGRQIFAEAVCRPELGSLEAVYWGSPRSELRLELCDKHSLVVRIRYSIVVWSRTRGHKGCQASIHTRTAGVVSHPAAHQALAAISSGFKSIASRPLSR